MIPCSLFIGKDIHYLTDETFYTDPAVTSPGLGGTVYFNMPSAYLDDALVKDYAKKQM